MTPTARSVPDVLLERYLADDLGAEARARIDAELASSPALRERLADLQASRDAFLAADPPSRFAHRVAVQAAVTPPRPGRRLWWALAPAGAAAAGVLVVVVGLRQPDGARTTRPEWAEQHDAPASPAVAPPVERPSVPLAEAAVAPRDEAPPAAARARDHEAARRAPSPLPATDGSRSLEGQGLDGAAAPAPRGAVAPPSPLRAFEPAAKAQRAAKKEASVRAGARREAESADAVGSVARGEAVPADAVRAGTRDEAVPAEAKSKSAASEDAAADEVRAHSAPATRPTFAPPTAAPPTFAPPAPVPPPRPVASAESRSRGAVDEPSARSLAQPSGARAVDVAGPGEREAAPASEGITALDVRGPVTPAQVTAVLRADRARLQALWASTGGATAIRLVLDVDEKGLVTRVRVAEPQDEQGVERVRVLARTWRFPAAPGRGASTITLALRPR